MKVEPQLPGEGVLGPLPTPCRFIIFNYVGLGTGVQSCFGLEDFFHLTVKRPPFQKKDACFSRHERGPRLP